MGGRGEERRVTYSTYSISFAFASLDASRFNTYLKKEKSVRKLLMRIT